MAHPRGNAAPYSDSIRRHTANWYAVGVSPWGGPRANMQTKIASDEAARPAAPLANGIGLKR